MKGYVVSKGRQSLHNLYTLVMDISLEHKFDGARRNLKCPLVGIVNATGSTCHVEVQLWVAAPGPEVITTLDQVSDHNVLIWSEAVRPIAALTMSGCFVEIKRYLNRHLRCVTDSNFGRESIGRCRKDSVRTWIATA